MRILYLGNNRIGLQVCQWLKEQDENIVGLVLHPSSKRKYGNEIIQCADVKPEYIFDGSQLKSPPILQAITDLRPDLVLSVFFGYILRDDFIRIPTKGCINVHPAFLPYNRGSYPNVWSIIDGTPAGVTIHYIDEGVDTGDIIARLDIPIEAIDTGETLYAKLEQGCLDLFMETWSLIRKDDVPRLSQLNEKGTTHRIQDVAQIDKIDLDQEYTARELINIIRARTFPPYSGAYFLDDSGRKVFLRLQLDRDDDLGGENDS